MRVRFTKSACSIELRNHKYYGAGLKVFKNDNDLIIRFCIPKKDCIKYYQVGLYEFYGNTTEYKKGE